MADSLREALERLLAVIKPKYTDPDEIVAVVRAIAAARAALAAEPPAPAPADHVPDAGNMVAADEEREEREELARWLEFEADNAQELGCATIYDHDRLRWVAGYLRQPAPAPMPVPVAVSQRLPEPRDCDADGRCWVGCAAQIDQTGDFDAEYNASWELCPVHPQDEVWLPHWAIPQPPQGGEVES